MKGAISFGVDENGKIFSDSISLRYDAEVEPTALEAEALKYIVEAAGPVKLYRRSDNYLTVCNQAGNDFCRLKASERAKWISLDIWSCDFQEDPRLAGVANKNQRHWKIKLNDFSDIEKYSDIIKAASK